MGGHDRLGDRQAQASTIGVWVAARFVHPEEAVKQPGQNLGGNGGAPVGEAQRNGRVLLPDHHRHIGIVR